VIDVQVKPSTGMTGRSKGLSSDECHRACQTYETVFKPCEACHFVQTCLRQAGSEIIAVCNGQQLPSDLGKHVQMLVGVEWMTAQDVARWTGEFNKDLQRIVKHFTDVATTCAAVKTSLATEQQATAKLKQELNQCRNDIKLEKETQDIMRKQFDTKLKSAESRTTDRINEFQSRLDDARKKCGELQNNLDQLELKRNQEHRERQLLGNTTNYSYTCPMFIVYFYSTTDVSSI
jgi:predicted RND superfamily exporter protein